MGMLTRDRPKPLLEVGGTPLIEYHVRALIRAGATKIYINAAYQATMIEQYVAEQNYRAEVEVVNEGPTPLETAGGIINVIPRFHRESFVIVNSDIFTDFDFSDLFSNELPAHCDARLVLTENPAHHPGGDFHFVDNESARLRPVGDAPNGAPGYTYSGIAILSKRLFDGIAPGVVPLGPLLRRAAAADRVEGAVMQARWIDVGTPERLGEANSLVKSKA